MDSMFEQAQDHCPGWQTPEPEMAVRIHSLAAGHDVMVGFWAATTATRERTAAEYFILRTGFEGWTGSRGFIFFSTSEMKFDFQERMNWKYVRQSCGIYLGRRGKEMANGVLYVVVVGTAGHQCTEVPRNVAVMKLPG